MIIELTPETYFEYVKREGPIHVVMHYGQTCGPCKMTLPHYELVAAHFLEHNITNVKFYKFHQWDINYKQFIEDNNLKLKGVPTFKHYYMGELLNEITGSYIDPNPIKANITEIIRGIESTMGEFKFYES